MAIESRRVYEWGSVLGEVLFVLLGFWMISWGWTGFGWSVVVVGIVGFVGSSARLLRALRQPADG